MINQREDKVAMVHGCIDEMFAAFDPSTDVWLWVKLVEEETNECLDAMRLNDKLNGLKEAADLAYVVTGLSKVLPEEDALTHEQWASIRYTMDEAFFVASEIMDFFDFNHEQTTEAFLRVHASNMTKLGDDGLPIRREDGKIMKGPNYREPELADLIV